MESWTGMTLPKKFFRLLLWHRNSIILRRPKADASSDSCSRLNRYAASKKEEKTAVDIIYEP